MRRFPTLKQLFKEAFGDDEFWKDITKHKPKPIPPSRSSTPAELMRSVGEEPPNQEKEKSVGFSDIVPQPKIDMSSSTAKNLGFKKITNFYVNPEHWKRGHEGDSSAMQWEASDWLEPVSQEAKKFVKISNLTGRKATDALRKDVWDKFFKNDFGEMS